MPLVIIKKVCQTLQALILYYFVYFLTGFSSERISEQGFIEGLRKIVAILPTFHIAVLRNHGCNLQKGTTKSKGLQCGYIVT